MDEFEGMAAERVTEYIEAKEATARAHILEMVCSYFASLASYWSLVKRGSVFAPSKVILPGLEISTS